MTHTVPIDPEPVAADQPAPASPGEVEHAMASVEGGAMAKKPRGTQWTCPYCQQQFPIRKGPPHARWCKKRPASERTGTPKRINRAARAVVVTADSFPALLASFEQAAKALAEGFKALLVERNQYLRERDEQAALVARIQAAFAGGGADGGSVSERQLRASWPSST